MTKARRKANAKAKVAIDIIGPTDQQHEQYHYERALLAYRRVAVITTLHRGGKLSERQFNALSRYRDIGLKCERSEIMDSCARLLHVAGHDAGGMSPSTLRAMSELGWLERELGSLRPIARAICIDDMTVSEWAMRDGGSVMRERDGRGSSVIRWFEPRRKYLQAAMLEIQMAGERLASAIGA